jgi:hypothetical protein
VTELGLPDLAVSGDPGALEVGQDGGHDFLAFALATVNLQPAPAADSEFVHVQHDDLVAAIPA